MCALSESGVSGTEPSPTHALAPFARGFLAMLPLWAGAIPLGIAYGVAARGVGLGPGATQLMSLVVFSAAAQVSAVTLLEERSAAPVLIGTAMALNVQLLLLGLAAGRQLRPGWWARLATAWFLTDGAYGVTAAHGPLRLPVLLGAGVSMYVAWNAGTALGALAGHLLPDPRRLGIDFIASLAFLAVLVPLVRTRATAAVALVAGGTVLVIGRLAPAGVAVLSAGVAGSAAGAWLRHREGRTAAPEMTASTGERPR